MCTVLFFKNKMKIKYAKSVTFILKHLLIDVDSFKNTQFLKLVYSKLQILIEIIIQMM